MTLPQVGDRSLPAGTTFTVDNPAFVIADAGTAYFTVPADAKPGDVFTTTVTIRYPDGSYETEEIRVTAGMAYNPSYGDPVAAALGGSGTALLTFEVVPDVSEAHITAANDHDAGAFAAATSVLGSTQDELVAASDKAGASDCADVHAG